MTPIENTARVTTDYDGNLHFLNVDMSDNSAEFSYVCVVQNFVLSVIVTGDDQKIEAVMPSGPPQSMAPSIMWASPRQIALRGETKRLKCIFAGFPTPTVTWRSEDGQLMELDGRVHTDSFGQELVFTDVQFSDQGTYVCTAANSGNEQQSWTTEIRVESAPYWRNDQPPENVTVAEEESAQFDCEVEGVPAPVIAWFVNGVPIRDLTANPRRTVGINYLRYENVTITDTQVVQCNASNKYGYVFANAYLRVIGEPPAFIQALPPVTTVSEGDSIVLMCRVFGAPRPVVTWKKSGDDVVLGGRFTKDRRDSLSISDIQREDEGIYYCVAENKFGRESVNGLLLVRSATTETIEHEP